MYHDKSTCHLLAWANIKWSRRCVQELISKDRRSENYQGLKWLARRLNVIGKGSTLYHDRRVISGDTTILVKLLPRDIKKDTRDLYSPISIPGPQNLLNGEDPPHSPLLFVQRGEFNRGYWIGCIYKFINLSRPTRTNTIWPRSTS